MIIKLKEVRGNVLYALEPADTKPTFEWLTCTSRRYTFFYLAIMLFFVNQFHWILSFFFSNSWLNNIWSMYKLAIVSIFVFFLTCGLYIYNLDAIQEKLTLSLKRLLQKIRKLDPKTPWQKIVMNNLHCDDELQDIIVALNKKSTQIQHHIDYLEKLIWFIQHEFNTPLAISHLHLERLKKKWLGKDKEFEGIEEELSHMKSLVDALVWLIKSKTEWFDIERVSISQVVQQVSEKLQAIHPESNFDIHVGQDVMIQSNKQYIWAICRNICENAIKHWSDKVKISLNKKTLTIQDNWPGMSDEIREKIRLPFWKKTPRAGKQEWFGLWLSLVKVLVDKLKWQVDVKNWQTWWTQFIFTHSD